MKRNYIIFLSLFLVLAFSVSSYALCVKVPEANLRSGPGTNYQKTWEVFKYMPFKDLEKKGAWYRVKDLDGDVHWIYGKLVTDKYNCAVIKVDKANIRTGPGTNYSKKYYSPGLKYDSFKVIKRKGGWVKVLDEFGEQGWIFRKLVWIY